jgi:hypothetical protein
MSFSGDPVWGGSLSAGSNYLDTKTKEENHETHEKYQKRQEGKSNRSQRFILFVSVFFRVVRGFGDFPFSSLLGVSVSLWLVSVRAGSVSDGSAPVAYASGSWGLVR